MLLLVLVLFLARSQPDEIGLGASERNPTRKSFEGTGGTAHTVLKILLQ